MKIDRKAQMMDAGMSIKRFEGSYGEAIGQMKAELEVYGKVLRRSDMEDGMLPPSTGECDLFLNFSNFWRRRYLSCRLEVVSEGRYAVCLKEGNRSSTLRDLAHILGIAAGFVLFCIPAPSFIPAGGLIAAILGVALIAASSISWITPSAYSRKVVAELLGK